MPPESAVPGLKSLLVRPPLRPTIVTVFIAVANIRAPAVLQILARSIKTIAKGVPLQIPCVTVWGSIPSAWTSIATLTIAALTITTLAIRSGWRWRIAIAILGRSTQR